MQRVEGREGESPGDPGEEARGCAEALCRHVGGAGVCLAVWLERSAAGGRGEEQGGRQVAKPVGCRDVDFFSAMMQCVAMGF